MLRPLLPLRFFWGPIVIAAVGLTVSAFLIPFMLPTTLFVCIILAVAVLTRGRPLVRLCLRIVTWRSRKARTVALFFPASLEQSISAGEVVDTCQRDVDDLVALFQFPPSSKIAIYLFEQERDINSLLGGNTYACAFIPFNAVLVPAGRSFQTMLRHELAHLFSARVGDLAPRLKSEGLAVWIECDGLVPTPDQAALTFLAKSGGLDSLLEPTLFDCPRTWRQCYDIAGSFTKFLIQRVGWAAYCQFYKAAGQANYGAVFERSFSLSLARAEALWQESLKAEDESAKKLAEGDNGDVLRK